MRGIINMNYFQICVGFQKSNQIMKNLEFKLYILRGISRGITFPTQKIETKYEAKILIGNGVFRSYPTVILCRTHATFRTISALPFFSRTITKITRSYKVIIFHLLFVSIFIAIFFRNLQCVTQRPQNSKMARKFRISVETNYGQQVPEKSHKMVCIILLLIFLLGYIFCLFVSDLFSLQFTKLLKSTQYKNRTM